MIYCFSGTGNTLRAAALLAEKLNTSLHRFSADELRSPETTRLVSEDNIIIWAFPTYSWGIPPVVRNIMRQAALDFKEDSVHLALTTCGDDVGNLERMFSKEIVNRGFTPGAVFSVQMPNTYVMMKGFDVDSREVETQKLENCASVVDSIAATIIEGHYEGSFSKVTRGGFPRFKTGVIYPWFVRYKMSARFFNVDKSTCIGCGRCAEVCPMTNITYDANTNPVWGDNCAFCTACYHVCPTHSIGWKKTTVDKGQYRHFLNKK